MVSKPLRINNGRSQRKTSENVRLKITHQGLYCHPLPLQDLRRHHA